MYRCPACSKLSALSAFEAGERGEHALEAKTCRYIGGGRSGRPKVQAVDDNGNPAFTRDGEPKMVLVKDDDGRPLPGRGMEWSSRDLTHNERAEIVLVLRTVANRLAAELAEDELRSAATRQEFETLAGAYLDAGHAELAERKRIIERMRNEMDF